MNTRYLSAIVAALLLAFASAAHAQISITSMSTPLTEDFSSVTTYTLPANWKVDKNASLTRIPATYTAASSIADRRGGNNLSSSASNGIYNFGAGDSAAATDRSIGFLSSSSATKTGNLYAWYRNNTVGNIASFSVSYNVEKYRMGINTAGFSMIMWYSYDGITWTSAPTTFTTDIPGDAGTVNSGYASTPGATYPVAGTVTFATPLAPNTDMYLAWTYAVTSGTTTSNAQALAIDDVTIIANPAAAQLPTYVQFASSTSAFSEGAGTVSVTVSISNPSATTATTVDVVLTGGTATNGTDVQPAYTTQTITFPANATASKTVTFTIFDDAQFEGDETLIFGLQNVAGGTSAALGVPTTHTLTIMENDSPPVPDVVVNEYFNSNGDVSDYEAIELIVVKDGLDMRGWSVADATSGGTFPYGSITFSSDALWSNLQAGTIIVIGGVFSVPTQDLDASDGLLMVQAPKGGNSNQYFIAGSSIPSIAAGSDGVAVRDASNAFVHGLSHGTANQNTFPAGRRGWVSGSVASGQSVGFTRSGAAMSVMDFLKDSYAAFVTMSLGSANDIDGNLSALRTFRTRTITASRTLAGTFFWNVSIGGGATVTLAGPVNVGNSLAVNDGTLNENGQGLSANGSGNAQNLTGTGAFTVGDNAGTAASLLLTSSLGTITGTVNFAGTDATVEYRGTAAQTVLPTTYNNLVITNGGTGARKTLASAATVNNALTINSGAYLDVAKPNIVTLGSTGTYTNSGRFLGSIRTTRTVSTLGVAENFGGIGISITPTAATVPGATTATMTCGSYLWVGNLPSILKYYTVSAAAGTGNNATVVCRYETLDLNGQTEANLGLQWSSNGGSTWNALAGTLATGTKSITYATTSVNGIWTAHANPPQGMIVGTPASLAFNSERNFTPLPVPQTLNVTNANAAGSIVEWSAVAAVSNGPAGWLTITSSPATGVNAGSFAVNVTRNDMTAGTYNGTITITDPHASNTPLVIPVTYTIQAPRLICVGADTIVIKASYKKGNPSKAVAVLNCGGAYGPDVINWSVSTTTPWFTLSPTSGSEGQSFTITADIFQKQPGPFYGSVTITGTHSVRGTPISNSPLTIPVVVEIEDGKPATGTSTNLTAGGERTIYNAQGMRVAKVKLNSGSITSITVRAFPGQLPEGIARMRYVNRYYQFDVTGTNYNVDVTLYYTTNELGAMVISNPQDLRGWRQYPVAGMWYAATSSSAPISNTVTLTGITDLTGNWAMAVPYFPVTIPMKAFRAGWSGESQSVVRWESELQTAPCGFIVERTIRARDTWSCVGSVSMNTSGSYEFTDRADSRESYEYRLLAIDDFGTAYETDPITLDSRILGTQPEAAPSEFSIAQSVPHPVMQQGSALVRFTLPGAAHAVLALSDALGRTVRTITDADLQAGTHTAVLDASGLASGTYVCTLTAGGRTAVRTLVIGR